MPFKHHEIDGLDEMLRQLNRAPAELKRELREAGAEVAEPIATDARKRARRSSKQLAAVAPTIKAKKDRIPSIQAGGAKRVTSSGAKAYQIFYGANFGTTGARPQFPHRIKKGRTIHPAIEEASDDIAVTYLDRVQGVFRG